MVNYLSAMHCGRAVICTYNSSKRHVNQVQDDNLLLRQNHEKMGGGRAGGRVSTSPLANS